MENETEQNNRSSGGNQTESDMKENGSGTLSPSVLIHFVKSIVETSSLDGVHAKSIGKKSLL